MKPSSVGYVLALLLVSLLLFLASCAEDASDDDPSLGEDGDAVQAYCIQGSHWEDGECVPDQADPADGEDDDDDNDDTTDGDDASDDDDDNNDTTDGDDTSDDDDDDNDDATDGDAPTDGDSGDDDDDLTDDDDDTTDGDTTDGDQPPASCDFGYDFRYKSVNPVPRRADFVLPWMDTTAGVDAIAHIEPEPAGFWTTRTKAAKDIVLPDYDDTMPLFPRASAWGGSERCYELPDGAVFFTEAQAYDFYTGMIEETLWQTVVRTANRRTVLGLRGAYPGTFAWHENLPNRFNDTLVLLWIDASGGRHVREFPVNTDTGAYDFGYHASSSLRPNRRYPYKNGWHRGYNALAINASEYPVRDDNNKNGHWDDDRNGWLAPSGADDHDRTGSGHNIHMGSKNAPLETAAVGVWSAGCQVIPGMENWLEFITNAWTGEGDNVDYFLLDVRDIAPEFWQPCQAENGTHACPYRIRSFPYQHAGNTEGREERYYDSYNCSATNESGPEMVYVMNLTASGTLTATVSVADEETIDPDVHLLSGDDNQACLARGHQSLSLALPPGRFVLVVDTWVNASGVELRGAYNLTVTFQ